MGQRVKRYTPEFRRQMVELPVPGARSRSWRQSSVARAGRYGIGSSKPIGIVGMAMAG